MKDENIKGGNLENRSIKEVIKSTGQKEPFRVEKIRKSVENAIKDAGFNVDDKKSLLEHATTNAIKISQPEQQVKTQAIRNEVLQYLEQNEPQVAKAWKKYEHEHGINY